MWGKKAENAVSIFKGQLHWSYSYKPMHWNELTKSLKKYFLEAHICVEVKRNGKVRARKLIGQNKQRDYITKEDGTPSTVSAEAVVLPCVKDAREKHEVAVINIPNAFAY